MTWSRTVRMAVTNMAAVSSQAFLYIHVFLEADVYVNC